MRTIDRYMAGQFVGPFVVGIAAFVGIIMGVSQIYEAVKLVVRDDYPLGMVLQVFLLRIPTVVALTMPMATVFAALMCAGELSSHGEIVAMRAGGVSIWRMFVPVLIAGLAVSVLTFGFNEALGPISNDRANSLLRDYLRTHRGLEKSVMFRIPDEGPVQRIVYADKVNLQQQSMTNVSIIEFQPRGRDVYFAERAVWKGKSWYLLDVIHKHDTGSGYREETVHEIRYDIGRTPDTINAKSRKRPEDLSLAELRQEVGRLAATADVQAVDRERSLWLDQHFHLRIATPWAALGFALLGFPLGMRPQRTSTGVGFGISLAVVFVYYIVFNVLRAFGEQGAMCPLVAAWLPNIVVLGTGLGLMIETSR